MWVQSKWSEKSKVGKTDSEYKVEKRGRCLEVLNLKMLVA